MDNSNNNNNNTHLAQEITDLKIQSDKLFEQNMGFIEKMAKIETQHETIKEQQTRMCSQMDQLQQNISKEIRNSVSNSLSNVAQLLISQSETQRRIIDVQSRQEQQIEDIRKTLDEFTNIRAIVGGHEERLLRLEKEEDEFQDYGSRLVLLESDLSKIHENDKARTQGKWAVITALVTGILSLIGVIVTVFVK